MSCAVIISETNWPCALTSESHCKSTEKVCEVSETFEVKIASLVYRLKSVPLTEMVRADSEPR